MKVYVAHILPAANVSRSPDTHTTCNMQLAITKIFISFLLTITWFNSPRYRNRATHSSGALFGPNAATSESPKAVPPAHQTSSLPRDFQPAFYVTPSSDYFPRCPKGMSGLSTTSHLLLSYTIANIHRYRVPTFVLANFRQIGPMCLHLSATTSGKSWLSLGERLHYWYAISRIASRALSTSLEL